MELADTLAISIHRAGTTTTTKEMCVYDIFKNYHTQGHAAVLQYQLHY